MPHDKEQHDKVVAELNRMGLYEQDLSQESFDATFGDETGTSNVLRGADQARESINAAINQLLYGKPYKNMEEVLEAGENPFLMGPGTIKSVSGVSSKIIPPTDKSLNPLRARPTASNENIPKTRTKPKEITSDDNLIQEFREFDRTIQETMDTGNSPANALSTQNKTRARDIILRLGPDKMEKLFNMGPEEFASVEHGLHPTFTLLAF